LINLNQIKMQLFQKISLCLVVFFFSTLSIFAQSEKFGKTLNLGIGVGYYGYINRNVPVLHADIEFDVANNFTLAPSISFFSYRNTYYWGNNKNPYKYYNYSQTIVPVGVKGTYYFDKLLLANSKWDF